MRIPYHVAREHGYVKQDAVGFAVTRKKSLRILTHLQYALKWSAAVCSRPAEKSRRGSGGTFQKWNGIDLKRSR
jgi:hypothetical protein